MLVLPLIVLQINNGENSHLVVHSNVARHAIRSECQQHDSGYISSTVPLESFHSFCSLGFWFVRSRHDLILGCYLIFLSLRGRVNLILAEALNSIE